MTELSNPQWMRSPTEYKLAFQELGIKTSDGQVLNAYYIPAHRLDQETKEFIPIINKDIAKSIREQGRKVKDLDIFETLEDQLEPNDSDNGDNSEDEDNDQSSGLDSSGSDSDIIEFETPVSRRNPNQSITQTKQDNQPLKHPKKLTTLPKKSPKPASSPPSSKSNSLNFLYEHSSLDQIDDDSTYHLYDVVSNPKHHVDDDIPTMLWFHGNAGNIANRLPNIYHTVCTQSTNILIIDYRGYGNSSECEPSEEGLVIDAASSFVYLQNRVDINPKFTFIFGQSLGSAVAIALTAAIELGINRRGKYEKELGKGKEQKAKQQNGQNGDEGNDDDDDDDNNYEKLDKLRTNLQREVRFERKNLGRDGYDIIDSISPMLFNIQPPCGIIIENTFTSIGDVVDISFPAFISTFKSILLRLKWDSLQRISKISTIPVLCLSSTNDEVLHPEMMKVLYDAIPQRNKAIHFVKGAHHNDAWLLGGLRYCAVIQSFMQFTAADENVSPLSDGSDGKQTERVQFNSNEWENFCDFSFQTKINSPNATQVDVAVKRLVGMLSTVNKGV